MAAKKSSVDWLWLIDYFSRYRTDFSLIDDLIDEAPELPEDFKMRLEETPVCELITGEQDSSGCDFHGFFFENRALRSICALRQLKDALVEGNNPLASSLRKSSGLVRENDVISVDSGIVSDKDVQVLSISKTYTNTLYDENPVEPVSRSNSVELILSNRDNQLLICNADANDDFQQNQSDNVNSGNRMLECIYGGGAKQCILEDEANAADTGNQFQLQNVVSLNVFPTGSGSIAVNLENGTENVCQKVASSESGGYNHEKIDVAMGESCFLSSPSTLSPVSPSNSTDDSGQNVCKNCKNSNEDHQLLICPLCACHDAVSERNVAKSKYNEAKEKVNLARKKLAAFVGEEHPIRDHLFRSVAT